MNMRLNNSNNRSAEIKQPFGKLPSLTWRYLPLLQNTQELPTTWNLNHSIWKSDLFINNYTYFSRFAIHLYLSKNTRIISHPILHYNVLLAWLTLPLSPHFCFCTNAILLSSFLTSLVKEHLYPSSSSTVFFFYGMQNCH